MICLAYLRAYRLYLIERETQATRMIDRLIERVSLA